MSRYSETDTYSQAADWLMGTARRKPEALLLLAAGCCLLMRSGGNSSSRADSHSRHGEDSERYQSEPSRAPSEIGRAPSNVREGLSRAADSATDYASHIKDRVSDLASSYAESISEFADDTRRNVSERSARLKRQAQSTLQSGMDRVLRDQPLAVAMAGLAAGAAVAAVFPSTEIEDRTLGGAREALTEAASKAGDRVVGAAGKAGERLKSGAEERGLTSEGLKELAGEVTDTFTSAVSGKSDEKGPTTIVPPSPAAATGPQSFRPGQGKPEANRNADKTRADIEPARGNR
jgi:cell division septum initiation protein DivIVA